MALRTITLGHRDLRQISIHLCYDAAFGFGFLGPDVRQRVGEQTCRQWSELDRLLVQINELHSSRLMLICLTLKKEVEEMRDPIEYLLPEMAERGLIELCLDLD